ncbi:MAG: hypothetical protein U9Q73_03370 [Nanoarchaeota archaeon]|nr:hypothetical protein [Nanoarchaeota archaeon]
MKILTYSFEKFHTLKTNPAYEIGKIILKQFNSKNVDLIQLPVTYDCWEKLKEKIDEFKPNLVLGIGVAKINKVKIEKIGLNYKHTESLDNNGNKTIMEKIDSSKDLAYETDFDILDFVEKLKNKKIPAEVSFNAETYICNYTYFNCLQYLKNTSIKTVFIHVPISPEEAIELNTDIPVFPPQLIANEIFNILSKME